MFYYAYINESNICTGVYSLPSAITMPGYIEITQEQYTSQSVVGKHYNAETGEWEDPIIFACTTDDVDYKGTGTMLTDKLDDMDEAIAAAAEDDHTHSNKTVLDGITAEKVAAWDNGTGGSGTGTPGADGADGATFTPSVATDGTLSWTNDKGLTNPSPVNIKGADGTNGTNGADGVTPHIGTNGNWYIGETDTGVSAQGASGSEITAAQILEKLKTVDGQNSGLDADLLDGHNTDYFATATQLAGKANTDHTHDNYSPSTHTHTPASIGAASSSHSHTAAEIGAASSSHSHSGYASSSHTHTPASIGASASGHSHSTNGACDFTGTIHTQTVAPASNDTYNIGGYSNRYKYIYSVNQLQVSSDERLKKDINALSVDELFAFVNALNVVEYKYKADESNKERIGLIAQEVVKANPALADYFVREEEDGMLGLSAADLVFALIAAVQKLTKEFEEFKK